MSTTAKTKTFGYLPPDAPPWGAMISLGFQQVLTMFPATVLVAILTKFDVGVTLAASGIGTIIAASANPSHISFRHLSLVCITIIHKALRDV